MKKIIAFSLIFACLGLLIFGSTVSFCLTSLNKNAIMIDTPDAAQACSENLMTAIQHGNYDAASSYLYGQVDLGLNREPANDLGKLVWEAFADSFHFEFTGDCYATTTGIARDVWITTLNPASVNQDLAQRVEELAKTAEGDAEDLLLKALADALEEDALSITQKVQLNLIYQNGQWWVVPDAPLLQAISGGVAG